MSRRQAEVSAATSMAPTASSLSSFARPDGRGRRSPHGCFRECNILAGHLRNRTWVKVFEEAASFSSVVLLIGREHDQEETVFGRERETRHVKDRMVRHRQAIQSQHAKYG